MSSRPTQKILRAIVTLAYIVSFRLIAQIPPEQAGSRDAPKVSLARVEGKIINAVTAAPLGMVKLTMRGGHSSAAGNYATKSNAEGVFFIDNIEPGLYTLSAEKAGFLKQVFGEPRVTPLRLSGGQQIKDILVKLKPQGVISGRVNDETGEPMLHVQVEAMHWEYSKGKRALRWAGGTFTNDIGEYRIANLPAGDYYLLARGGDLIAGLLPFFSARIPSARIPERPEEAYGPTYYPGSLESTGAAAVQVTPGAELRDIVIQPRKARVFRVRGRVIDNVSGQTVPEAVVLLSPAAFNYRQVSQMSSLNGPRIPGGNFEAIEVVPGSYYATAESTINNQTLYARQLVEVVDRNVTDVIIRIPRAVDVAGRVRISGLDELTLPQQQSPSQQVFRMDKVWIDLTPAEGFGIGESSPIAARADGSFVLHNVVPDKYRFYFGGTPAGSYLKSIRVGGQEYPDQVVELSGGSFVEILFAMGASQITGSVVGADDKPAAGATVTLVPDDKSNRERIDLFRNTKADQNGQFQLQNVVPGAYKIYAWDEIDSDAAQDREFLQPFESKATSLSLDEHDRKDVPLKAISAVDVAKAFGNPR